MKNSFLMLVIASSFTMCSCSCSQDPQYHDTPVYDSPQPQPIQQPVQGGTTIIQPNNDNGSGVATGFIIGSLLSQNHSNNGGGYAQPRARKKVVNNTTIIHQTVQAPRYTQRTSARVITTTRSAPSYTPSRIRTSTSMSSRSMSRRGR